MTTDEKTENANSWAIFSVNKQDFVIRGMSKKEAVMKRVKLLGTLEYSNDKLKVFKLT
jgi:hypothetical protein